MNRLASTIVLVSSSASVALAQPTVFPPAGAPAESGRFGVRTEITPTTTPGDADSTFRITEPGSYYLTKNLVGEVGKTGIEISTSDVTLDLMGFTLEGVPGALSGVSLPREGDDEMYPRLVVHNGTIIDWDEAGIEFFIVPGGPMPPIARAPESLLHDLTVRGCGTGIRASSNTTVQRCLASDNVGLGIGVNAWSSVRDCLSTRNGGSGFLVGSRGSIEACASADNGGNGISTSGGVTIRGCTSRGNTLLGIDEANSRGHIIECTVHSNGQGGIDLGASSRADRCSIVENDGDGVRITFGSVVTDCDIADNSGDGVVTQPLAAANSDILIQGCSITSNGGFGLDLTGCQGARIFQNLLQANVTGDLTGEVDDSAPVSNTPATAGRWFNISL